MKFLLFVEGKTEKHSIAELIKRRLDPRLGQSVGIQTIAFRGFGDYLSEIRDRVHLHLTSKNRDQIIATVGLIDLYGPGIFPAGLSYSQKATWGKTHLEQLVGHPKFKQFFAVHETEAWLLAQREILPESVRDTLPRSALQPESVNLNEPPSRLLSRLYRDRLNRDYRKTIDGRKLFLRCSPDVVAAKCPHFAQMLAQLEDLARASL